MIRIYLLLFLIVSGYVLVRQFLNAPKQKRDLYRKRLIIASVICLLVILALTGRLAWVAAMVGVIIAFFLRSLPILIRYAPYIQRFWQTFKRSNDRPEPFNNGNSRYHGKPNGAPMSAAEAYQILGLEPNASKQAIIMAHKKLIQKLHPDRGGSDYLAAQINLAKDVLLRS